jgi:hypothetical protein
MSFLLLPPCVCAGDVSHQTFDVIRKKLQLTCRESEPASIVDGSPTIYEDDDAVLAVKDRIDLLVNVGRVFFESLP